jgi:hypothetical protein
MAELNTLTSSLLLSSESRAFSFSICSVSRLSCFVRSLEALICFSMSGSCRQLSVSKNKRHRGSDEPHAPLLPELEADACQEGDVVIRTEEGVQGNHKAGIWAWRIPWRSNQGRRRGGSVRSAKPGSDSTGGTICAKTGDRQTLGIAQGYHFQPRAAPRGTHPAQRGLKTPSWDCPRFRTCRTEPYAGAQELRRDPSGAHEATGLGAAAVNAQHVKT